MSQEDLRAARDLYEAGRLGEMYDLFAAYGHRYASLASGVARGNMLSGLTAIEYMQATAEESGIVVGKPEIDLIRNEMARAFLETVETIARGGDLTREISADEAWDFHNRVFGNVGLTPDCWTLNTPFSLLDPTGRESLWDTLLMSNGRFPQDSTVGVVLIGTAFINSGESGNFWPWLERLAGTLDSWSATANRMAVELTQDLGGLQGVTAAELALLSLGLDSINGEISSDQINELILASTQLRRPTYAPVIYGGANGDTIDLSLHENRNITIAYGLNGNDTILGRDGKETLVGGSGVDVLDGRGGNDVLSGGAGNDTLKGGEGDDRLEGGSGFDRYVMETRTNGVRDYDTIVDSDGNGVIVIDGSETWLADVKAVAPGVWEAQSGSIRLSVTSESGRSVLHVRVRDSNTAFQVQGWQQGALGITLPSYSGQPVGAGAHTDDIVLGGPGGNSSADDYRGGTGNDGLAGGAGDDVLAGGDGADLLLGGTGDDRIYGGEGDDIIVDGSEMMSLQSWDDSDASRDENGTTQLTRINADIAALGSAVIARGAGWYAYRTGANPGAANSVVDDFVIVHPAGDTPDNPNINRGGDDFIDGGGGRDRIFAGEGNDIVFGGSGDDRIDAGCDDDIVLGGDGDDYIEGDTKRSAAGVGLGAHVSATAQWNGSDYLDGGAGHDTIFGGGGDDTILGGDGNDRLAGRWGDSTSSADNDDSDRDVLDGGAGDDELQGDDGDDHLYGGTGNDRLHGDNATVAVRDGNDYLDGGAGNDLLIGGGGSDQLLGGDDDDELQGDAAGLEGSRHGDDILDGGAGNDRLYGGGGADCLIGGDGDDELSGDGETLDSLFHGNDQLFGGKGNDLLRGGGGADFLDGGDGDDEMGGDAGDDTLLGGAGADRMYGGDGNDQIEGGSGDDRAYGGAGNDEIHGGEGADSLEGDDGDDLLSGDDGDDVILSGAGNDVAYGGAGNDYLRGDAGDDELSGGLGNDTLFGGMGADRLNGGSGDDALSGDDGNDSLYGGLGNDSLSGGTGDDRLEGGYGNDLLEGGAGNDILLGGAGSNLYRFGAGAGNDTLILTKGELAEIHFDGQISRETVAYTRDGPDLLITVNGQDSVRVVGAFGTTRPDLTVSFANGASEDFVSILAQVAPPNENWSTSSFQGAQGNDEIVGNNGRNTLVGGLGSDTLYGLGGDDLIIGDGYGRPWDGSATWDGSADDVAFGGDGNDQLLGGEGSDTLLGDSGRDLLDGGVGNDRLFGGTGDDDLTGDDGDDSLYGDSGDDALLGGTGNDLLIGGSGDDLLYGGRGADEYVFEAGFGADVIVAGDWDSVFGKTGPVLTEQLDHVRFGASLAGASFGQIRDANDLVISFSTGDSLRVQGFYSALLTVASISFADSRTIDVPQNLQLQATHGGAPVHGGEGNDHILGTRGADVLNGGDGDDVIDGGLGDDVIHGGSGNDVLSSGFYFNFNGPDETGFDSPVLFGDDGDDQLTLATYGSGSAYGGAGNDVLQGGSWLGEHILDGGDGDDVFNVNGYAKVTGGRGNDVISGGSTFVFGEDFGADKIANAEGNTLNFTDRSVGQLRVVVTSTDSWGSESSFTLRVEAVGSEDHVEWSGWPAIVIKTSDGVETYFNVDPSILRGRAIIGLGGDDNLVGAEGDGTLLGGDGNDVLDGRWVSLYASGGQGNDVYIAGGPGELTIASSDSLYGFSDSGDIDTLRIEGGLTLNDVSFTVDNFDLCVLRSDGTTLARIEGFFNGSVESGFEVDAIVFADGTSLSAEDIVALVPDAPRTVTGTDGDDVMTTGAGMDSIYGLEGGDMLSGGAGDDSLYGGGGNDYLDGGAGADYLSGGAGDDIYLVDSLDDYISETTLLWDTDTWTLTPVDDGGYDEIRSTVDVAMPDGVEKLVLLSPGRSAWGSDGANLIVTTGGGNSVFAQDGDDVVHVYGGQNFVDGGAGDDRYVLDGGHLTIDGSGGGEDMLQLVGVTEGISAGQDGDDLCIYVNNAECARVLGYFVTGSGLSTLQTGDGTTLLVSDLLASSLAAPASLSTAIRDSVDSADGAKRDAHASATTALSITAPVAAICRASSDDATEGASGVIPIEAPGRMIRVLDEREFAPLDDSSLRSGVVGGISTAPHAPSCSPLPAADEVGFGGVCMAELTDGTSAALDAYGGEPMERSQDGGGNRPMPLTGCPSDRLDDVVAWLSGVCGTQGEAKSEIGSYGREPFVALRGGYTLEPYADDLAAIAACNGLIGAMATADATTSQAASFSQLANLDVGLARLA